MYVCVQNKNACKHRSSSQPAPTGCDKWEKIYGVAMSQNAAHSTSSHIAVACTSSHQLTILNNFSHPTECRPTSFKLLSINWKKERGKMIHQKIWRKKKEHGGSAIALHIISSELF